MAADIIEIIGVYDADSTLVGELSYWIKARFGRAHCSLCDLTHGVFTVKSEWVKCTQSLGVPVTTYHRNDAPQDVQAIATEYPMLLIRTRDGLEMAADRSELAKFAGETHLFVSWLTGLVSA